ncbi:beta-lactamase/transpeptidase-like protein, partial [Lojkania enalia]
LKFDAVYYLASCTKPIATIAALQAVERGLIGLDDPLDQHLPELATQPIISAKGESDFELCPATKSITLRHLITHSSGAAYDMMDPKLILWRRLRGEVPDFPKTGLVAEHFPEPRVFEAGEGWMYGTGLDWAGLLVARLNDTKFGQYVEENIAKPLGITSFTWRPSEKPHVVDKVMRMSERGEDGKLVDGPNPIWPEPIGEGGGAGMYGNSEDFLRVLADLLKDEPVLLKKETVDLMFTPQFADGTAALKALYKVGSSPFGFAHIVGMSTEDVVANQGLGGVLVIEDVHRDDFEKPRGTLSWGGLPNLLWSVNREKGLALLYATQVIPWLEEESQKLGRQFETAVW